MIRRWIKKHKEYPFKLVDKKGKEIIIPINEDLTEYLETTEKVISLQYFLEVAYGIEIEIGWNEDIEGILESLEHLESVLK